MKQYDKNGNGQLEKEEWMEMKSEYRAADRDRNGIITLDELTAFLAADSGSGPRQSTSVAVASNAGANNAGANNAGANNAAAPGNAANRSTVRRRRPNACRRISPVGS